MATQTHSFDTVPLIPPAGHGNGHGLSQQRQPGLQVIRRNGSFSPFDTSKISVAITKAFVAVEGTEATASRRIREAVEVLTHQIVETLSRRSEPGRPIHIEDIQDQVELALMRSGEHKVARAYVLYREERAQERRKREERTPATSQPQLHVRLKDGRVEPLDEARLLQDIAAACAGLDGVSADAVMAEVRRNLYDGILLHELGLAQTMAARSLVEQDPNYAYVSARLLLNILREEALALVLPNEISTSQSHSKLDYKEYFPEFVRRGIELQILDRELGNFDLNRLAGCFETGARPQLPVSWTANSL